MAVATLDSIIAKIRRLTGTGTSLELTNAQIIDYINSFYLYDFPANFRSLKLKDKYSFNTVRGIDVYPFDSDHYSTVEMPCYCAKREIKLFNDPWSFFGVNFNWQYQQTLTQGTAALGAGPYTGTIQAAPVVRSVNNNPQVQTTLSSTANYLSSPSVPSFQQAIPGRVQNILITANTSLGSTQNVTDDGAGNLIQGSTNVGTINYDTGAISVTFLSIVPAGENITVQYNPTSPMAIPLSILFFQNQFTLRPIPDKGYLVELIAYRLPSQVLMGTDNPNSPNLAGRPELQEWWECIAFGAAKKIYEDRVDMDGVAMMDKALVERYQVAETRTYAQLGKQSISTLFRDQLSYNYGSGGWGFNSGAN